MTEFFYRHLYQPLEFEGVTLSTVKRFDHKTIRQMVKFIYVSLGTLDTT